MIIRTAKIKDIPIITQLAVKLLKYHEEFDPYFAPAKNAKDVYAKFFAKCIHSPKKQLLVAEHENKIIGYAMIDITSRPPVLKVKNIGVINDMFVEEKFRKKGVANKLLIGLLDWIKNKKSKYPELDYVELSVHTKNIIGRKAWAKYGFREFMSRQRMKI